MHPMISVAPGGASGGIPLSTSRPWANGGDAPPHYPAGDEGVERFRRVEHRLARATDGRFCDAAIPWRATRTMASIHASGQPLENRRRP